MKRRWPAWLAGILLALVALLALLTWAANRWLESAGGKARVERELSGALNIPVRLEGEFGVRLLPRLGLSGRDLLLEGVGGSPLAQIAEYSGSLALLPFLRRELRLSAVYLGSGRIDLDALPAWEPAAAAPAAAPPRIEHLLIEQLRIDQASLALALVVEHLELTGFAAGTATPLELRSRLFFEGQDTGFLDLQGLLTLVPAMDQVRLESRQALLRAAGIELGSSALVLEWSRGEDRVTLDLSGAAREGMQLGLELGARFSGPLSGTWALEFVPGAAGPRLQSSGEFASRSGGLRLEPLRLELNAQRVAGSGCVRFRDRVLLAMDLSAEQLDLGTLGGAGWFPAGQAGSTAESNRTESAELPTTLLPTTLPLDLAVSLRIGHAAAGEAELSGLHLVLGAEPDCAEFTSPASN